MTIEFRNEFFKVVRATIREREEFVCKGKATSYDKYREMVGEIKSLNEALVMFNDAAKRCADIGDEENE